MRPSRGILIVTAGAALAAVAVGVALYSGAVRSRLGTAVINEASAVSPAACYSAATETMAVFCGRRVTSTARLLRYGRGMWRVEYLSAPVTGILVGSDGQVQWRLVPGREVSVISASRTDEPRRLLLNYRARHSGHARVAGRLAHVVDLLDANGRLARRLYIDRERFVVLRTRIFDRRGQLVGESTIRQIYFLPYLPADVFQVPSNPWPPVTQTPSARECATSLAALAKAAGFTVKIPRWLPKPYRWKSSCLIHGPSACGCNVVHLNYSDGVRSFSIFETPACHHASCPFNPLGGQGTEGAVRPVQYGPGTAVTDLNGSPLIVAFGELPADQLEKVVRSAR